MIARAVQTNPPRRIAARMLVLWLACLVSAGALGGALARTAGAEPPRSSRFMTRAMPEEAQPYDKLQPVRAQGTRQIAYSKPRNALLLMRRGSDADHDITVIPLDADGNLRNDARKHFDLPAPDALRDYPLYAAHIEPHPERPIVYVWRDIDQRDEQPSVQLVHEHLDHLLVYELTDDHELKLVQQTGRGAAYSVDEGYGPMLFDPPRRRLFVPNTWAERERGGRSYQLAFTTVDDAGRVDVADGELQLTGQITNKFIYSSRSWPFDYLAISEDRVIAGAERGPMTWDLSRDAAPLFRYSLDGAGHHVELGEHPDLPVIYTVAPGTPHVFRTAHVRGYLTLLPQRVTLGEEVDLHWSTGPVIIEQGRQMAAGDREGRVFLFALDDEGRFTGEVQRLAISGDSYYGRAMHYIPAYDRLYVSVNEPPETAESEGESNE